MTRTNEILLVEDNPADVKIMQRAIQESGIQVHLISVHDGPEAIDYLLRQGRFLEQADWRFPDLVLMDLNLPGLSGCEVIAKIRSHESLRRLPIIVLTTSRREEDIQGVYHAGANTYIQKPQEFAQFVEVLRVIGLYWLNTALLPTRKR
jgi:CheY-like chemotaxis protein